MKKDNKKLIEQNNLLKEAFSDDKFINNVCLSYSHDFGFMEKEKQKRVLFECKEWMRAIINNWNYR